MIVHVDDRLVDDCLLTDEHIEKKLNVHYS